MANALPLAKASVACSLIVTGVFAGSSAIAIPAILATTDTATAVKQWNVLYNLGVKIAPSIVVAAFGTAAASSYFYTQLYPTLAFTNNKPATTILLSGVVTLLSLPWTIIAMKKTNDQLIGMGAGSVGTKKAVTDLIEFWGTANYIRSVFPLVGAVVGLYLL